ncbi:hypothetical protein [Glaciecola sp. SC05]|uniref:hypothetical protein n=1 Tax=Glaciecola sp. SC05 TaxID=1987355 RepID=UPI0035287DAC
MSEQFENASPDAYIQEQQRQRAQTLKRGALIVVALLAAAIVIGGGIALSTKNSDIDHNADSAAELETSFSLVEQEAARESFKQALADFESKISPSLDAIAQGQWQTQQIDDLQKRKERALALFANAGFMQALGILNGVSADAEALISDWHQAYEGKLLEAQQFYTNEQIQQARLALAQADRIKANTPESQTLRAQLSAYDRVQNYLSELAVARVENNLEKQVALMQQIIKADPTRRDLQGPLQNALSKLNQKRLAFALGKAQSALESGDISEAKTYIQQAEIIQPSAKGITALRNELDSRLANQSLNDIKSELTRLQAADAWPQVLSLAERGISRFSRDAQLQQTRSQASAILDAQRNIERFIARPDRLAEKNIREAAQNAIQAAILMLSSSGTLAQRAQTLAAYIDQYSTKVSVTVISDGKTDISVVGTGVVGRIDSKVIELSPGRYTFEGKREGYRSKRIDVSVDIDTPITVSLVSDEKI